MNATQPSAVPPVRAMLKAEMVAKTFPLPAGGEQTVLEHVNLYPTTGEVALLGRNGLLWRPLRDLAESKYGETS
jgi:hypothetical protein